MQADSREAMWLDQWQRLSIGELAIFSGLPELDLRELMDYGVLAPANPEGPAWAFSADCVSTIRKAARLRDDLELDNQAMALAIMLLDRIDELEARLAESRARIPFRFSAPMSFPQKRESS